MANQNLVGPQATQLGQPASTRSDDYGNTTILINGPKYVEWHRRGYMNVASFNIAATPIIFSTGTNTPTLWNPSDSSKLVVVTRVGMAACAYASGVATGFGALISYNMGNAAGGGQPFTTFTQLATLFNTLTGTNSGKCRIAAAAVGWTTLPTTTVWFGISQQNWAAPTAAGWSLT
jgi:hypothetical protein